MPKKEINGKLVDIEASNQEVLDKVAKSGQRLYLYPYKNDPKIVEVAMPIMVGYLDDESAKAASEAMSAGKRVTAVVSGVKGKRNKEVKVKLIYGE
jgi:hypothetical protein